MRFARRTGLRPLFALLVIAVALQQAPSVFAEECEIGELTLSSQTEVDAFQQLAGDGTVTCRILIGQLTIHQDPAAGDAFDDPIVSLAALSDVTEIRLITPYRPGSLTITGNPVLADLDGLSGLRNVEGELVISDNRSLTNIDGLRSLENVDSPGLLSPSSRLFIGNNPQLKNLDGLANLRLNNIGKESILIVQNASLENVNGLAGLRGSLRSVSVEDNPALSDLSGLAGITKGSLFLSHSPNIADLTAFGNWTGGTVLQISGMPTLTNLDGLQQARVTHVNIIDNQSLLSLEGLGPTDGPAFLNLSLIDNPSLTNIDAIAGKFFTDPAVIEIEGNEKLQQIDGLSGVEEVRGWLRITDNASLTSIDGLATLKRVPGYGPHSGSGINGDLTLTGNPALNDCSALGPVLGHPVTPWDPTQDKVNERVVINAGNGPGARSPDECLYAFEQSLNPELPDFRIAATGSWYDPATDGEGIYLFTDANQRMSLYYFGYTDSGENDWLIAFADGPWGWHYGEPITLEAFDAEGGTFNDLDPDSVLVSPWGTMTLTLDDCDSGELQLSGPPGDKSLALQRLGTVTGSPCNPPAFETTSTTSLNGAWYEPATSGQGFTVHHVSADRGMVTFFGFRDDGSPIWLVGVWEAPLVFGQEFQLDMLAFSGGAYESFDPRDVTNVRWGELTLRFDSCTTAEAVLDGIDGVQLLDLQLLAGAFGLPCAAPLSADGG